MEISSATVVEKKATKSVLVWLGVKMLSGRRKSLTALQSVLCVLCI